MGTQHSTLSISSGQFSFSSTGFSDDIISGTYVCELAFQQKYNCMRHTFVTATSSTGGLLAISANGEPNQLATGSATGL